MIWVRVSDWRWLAAELHWMLGYYSMRGISARMDMDDMGRFAVYREMEHEMGERLGWLEGDRRTSFQQRQDYYRGLDSEDLRGRATALLFLLPPF